MKNETLLPAAPLSGTDMPDARRQAWNCPERDRIHRFAIQAITGIMMLRYEDVLLFEYHKNMRKWQVRLTGDKVYNLRSTVTSVSITGLAAFFVQINQFSIINLFHLLSIENKTLNCLFDVATDTDTDLKISPLYYRRIKTMLDVL
jgi:two-component system LytT family response regulator